MSIEKQEINAFVAGVLYHGNAAVLPGRFATSIAEHVTARDVPRQAHARRDRLTRESAETFANASSLRPAGAPPVDGHELVTPPLSAKDAAAVPATIR